MVVTMAMSVVLPVMRAMDLRSRMAMIVRAQRTG